MELTGQVCAILPAQSGVSQRTGNTWMNQQYVIDIPGRFPRKCVFKVNGEAKIKQFAIQMGETITISIDIDAHEFNGKWYSEIEAYNVVRAGQGMPMQQGYQQPMQQGYPQQPMQPQYQQPMVQPQYQQQVQAPFPPQQAPAPFTQQQPVQQPSPQGQQLPFPPAQ